MYKVVPFLGQLVGSQSVEAVSKQLNDVITKHESEGWEFVQLAQTSIQVKPGCIQGLFGAKTSYETFDQIVFKK